jgi:phage gp16-like protein
VIEMTKPTVSASRKSLLARIHIAKKQLKLDEDMYREMLVQVTSKKSCADMHISDLYLVIKRLQQAGFKAKKRDHGKKPNPNKSQAAMMGKVEALLADNNLPWNYAHAMAKRMFKVDKVDWLTSQDLHKLIAALVISTNRGK